MTEEKKRGRGRPKGAPNKPVMELITERQNLTMNADVYEILCQAELVAQESEDLAVQGLQVFGSRIGAVKPFNSAATTRDRIGFIPIRFNATAIAIDTVITP